MTTPTLGCWRFFSASRAVGFVVQLEVVTTETTLPCQNFDRKHTELVEVAVVAVLEVVVEGEPWESKIYAVNSLGKFRVLDALVLSFWLVA